MQIPVIGGLLAGVLLLPAHLDAEGPRAGVDPRVELMSIIFRLAGSPEYTQGRLPAYNQAIDQYFGPFRDHLCVRLARGLRNTDGVSYDAVMSLAIHVTDVETLAERIPFDQPGIKLDARWHGAKARSFLDAARQFVADTGFGAFLDSQASLYESTNNALKRLVDTRLDSAWFEAFFGAKAGARFVVVPGLVNGPASYGPAFRGEDGADEMYSILGVWIVDAAGQAVFPDGLASTLVHEFSHSYANPFIDESITGMEDAAGRIYERVSAAMRAQGYGAPRVMLYESLVRASTTRYVLGHDGPDAARQAVLYEQARSFFWTGELFDLLGRYEDDRENYPTLESFMPEVVRYFNELAPRIGDLVR